MFGQDAFVQGNILLGSFPVQMQAVVNRMANDQLINTLQRENEDLKKEIEVLKGLIRQ